MLSHQLFGGDVQVFRRGKTWHARCRVDGNQYRESMHVTELSRAMERAEDWYLGLKGKLRAGIQLKPTKRSEPTFNDMADLFEAEYDLITQGERSEKWTKGHKDRLRLHLRPFFGEMGISEVDSSACQRYRAHRATQLSRQPQLKKKPDGTQAPSDRPDRRVKVGPSRKTIHNEMVTVNLVLKTALRHRKLDRLPDLSNPYRNSMKVKLRPRFTLEEYKTLYRAIRKKKTEVAERYKWNWEQLYDYVLFMVNTGLRPDEGDLVEHRDVKIIREGGEEILLIEVRGKRGVGWCKSMPGAVTPYRRLLARGRPGKAGRARERLYAEKRGEPMPPVEYTYPKPKDRLFPTEMASLLDKILIELDLKFDRDDQPRVAYSLRHSYICLRLENGADIYQVAKNCRTSVEMIQKNYAIHLQHTIDAGAVNRRKTKTRDSMMEDEE